MNISVGDAEISAGDVSDGLKGAAALSKSLPGMAKSNDEGSAVPKVTTDDLKAITDQPAVTSAEDALAKADQAADCCNKLCDCFGKGLDAADKVQAMTGAQ